MLPGWEINIWKKKNGLYLKKFVIVHESHDFERLSD